MNTHNSGQVLQDFVLEHRDELAQKLNLNPAEAAELLTQLGGDLYRRLLSNQLKLSKLLQAVSEATQDALFVKDLEGRYTWLNQAAARYVGKEVDEVLGQDDSQLFDAGGVDLLQRRHRQIIQSGRSETAEETLTAQGETRTFLATKAPYLDEYGQVAGIIGISRDITAQKLAEKQLGDSEALLRAIIDNARAVIWVKSLDGRFRIVNQSCCRYWQREAGEILGKTTFELFPPAQAEQLIQHESQVMASGQAAELEETLELDQEPKTFYSVKFPLLSASGEVQALAAISTDITSSKRLEKQFWQAQKMEAIGRLAGGVAHDFNNQLTIILGNCDLVLDSLQADNPDRELLMEVYRAGEHTARLTRQLLAFSRLAVTTPTSVDLNSLVAETARMLEGLVKNSVTCQLKLQEGVGQIQADPLQLEQLIMNLASNACDAMPQGGRLTLSTSRRRLEAPFAGLPPGIFAVLTVADTGVGVGAEIRDRIFDPFFTTKELGQGTGLGLAVAHGIVEQLGGAIQLESQDGAGTAFHCWFPVLQASGRAEADSTLTGSETILVIEDEAGVRKVARLALESKGYSVLEASSGAEAVRLLSHYQGPIHCILSDVVMPGMSGPQAVEAIRSQRPELPVVFMSGYLDESVTSREELAAGRGFVQKPFSPLSLAKTIRQVLDQTV
ncbi:MAG: PAS domain-containing protein [Candidatus Eremiobacteraeota bacterium]|nr:PAS domain-containing protein [Candidatus Eremiobacteraeota bacterium]MCW5872120.1 PAS domain-containing protein [Candidatus Eremiobacteraeota bacterium]